MTLLSSTKLKNKREMSSNFVVFTEYMNFTELELLMLIVIAVMKHISCSDPKLLHTARFVWFIYCSIKINLCFINIAFLKKIIR